MNRLNIEIRSATPAEASAIAALAREIWQAAYVELIGQAQIDFMLAQRYDHQRLRDDLASADKWLDLACHERHDGRPIGFAGSEICRGEFKLDKLYIHPDFQRHGVGGQLIAHVAARAGKLGYPGVILSVNKRNEKAIAAYRKHGFAVREATVVDIGGGFTMDDFVMEKKL